MLLTPGRLALLPCPIAVVFTRIMGGSSLDTEDHNLKKYDLPGSRPGGRNRGGEGGGAESATGVILLNACGRHVQCTRCVVDNTSSTRVQQSRRGHCHHTKTYTTFYNILYHIPPLGHPTPALLHTCHGKVVRISLEQENPVHVQLEHGHLLKVAPTRGYLAGDVVVRRPVHAPRRHVGVVRAVQPSP